SAVIKSVTGEDLTNYEIGGARIMNRVTGTVDRVARSNLHLLTVIHELQELFTGVKSLPAIRRIPVSKNKIGRDADDVLTPDIIKANMDNGLFVQFKDEYYGGGALTGGFGRMAGRPVLVMGPRSNMGLRSFQSMVRTAELLIEARKLAADQIVVLGDEWFSETPRTDAATLRARQDVLKLMSTKAGLRIHIATTVGGLRKIMLHSFCDALIFVRDRDYEERDEDVIRNSATHVVNSLDEAFDLSVRIMQLLRPIGSPQVQKADSVPALPAESTQPFDIVSSVIAPAFDANSFVEWWAEMNDSKKGPCLVTGFATLNGESVAILADQPAIMGGAPDAPGTEKFRMFTELAERNGIPIVMLSNAPGFVPGTRQERLRIQQIGGRSLDVNVLSTVPIVSVVLQQNYGGRQIHAFSKYLRPGTVSFALKSSILAVMGGSSAFDLFQGKKYAELRAAGKDAEAEQLRKTFVDDFNTKARAENDALGTGVLDMVIDSVAELRTNLISSLQLSRERNA
ncbi:MAG: carbamoyl-phosphate synthase subunit L, partial [Spirochaetae bacterium HGW-Spirochaetae-10]